jgi:predicted transposase YdaD
MKPENQTSLHDKFFKESMEHIVIAQGLSQLLLPQHLFFDIDYNSLHIEKDSWINTMFNLHSADILYRAKIKDTGQRILLLFEHKSFIDKSVVYQNYHNTSEVLEEELLQKKTSKRKLPPVIPVTIYHGNTRWNGDNSLRPMFEMIKGTESFIPQQKSIVIDLSIIPDEKIIGIAEVRAFIMALKYSRSPLLFEKTPEIVRMFSGVDAVRQRYLNVVTNYLQYAIPKNKRAKFSQIVKRELELGDENMKKFSSIWEELGYIAGNDDGFKKGKRIGIEKGFKNGVEYEKHIEDEKKKELLKSSHENIAIKMLKKGYIIEDVSNITGLSIEGLLVLKKKIDKGEL